MARSSTVQKGASALTVAQKQHRLAHDVSQQAAQLRHRFHFRANSRSAARLARTPPHGRLMLTVLGGLAEFERELIKARTGEGRAPGEG